MKALTVIVLLLLCSGAGYAQKLGPQLKSLSTNKSQELGLKDFRNKSNLDLYQFKKTDTKVNLSLKPRGATTDLRLDEKTRVSSKSGMLILKPDSTIHYPMLALKPDSTIRYHLQVKKPK